MRACVCVCVCVCVRVYARVRAPGHALACLCVNFYCSSSLFPFKSTPSSFPSLRPHKHTHSPVLITLNHRSGFPVVAPHGQKTYRLTASWKHRRTQCGHRLNRVLSLYTVLLHSSPASRSPCGRVKGTLALFSVLALRLTP